ncbi:hypothetical protein ACQKNS_16255 [Peribacillus sp. NPDC094092]|uniref:hypothetical protein n=1 Tax=Peribacillus sp. NPDC094092 TaxID=3390611 RepID=UPI003D0123E0
MAIWGVSLNGFFIGISSIVECVSWWSMHFSYVEYNGEKDGGAISRKSLPLAPSNDLLLFEFTLIIMNVGEVGFGGTMQKCLAGSVRPCDI